MRSDPYTAVQEHQDGSMMIETRSRDGQRYRLPVADINIPLVEYDRAVLPTENTAIKGDTTPTAELRWGR